MNTSVRLGLATLCLVFVPSESACSAITDIAGGMDAGSVGGQSATGGTNDNAGGSLTVGGGSPYVGALPCDILEGEGNPCVAAHSTVRRLSSSYGGPLYQVQRTSDNATLDIGVVDGVADSAAQDAFCSGTSCTVSVIYDQSMHDNELTIAPPGGNKPSPGNPAKATALKFTLNGR